MRKKLFSIILSLAMVLTMVPETVMATSYSGDTITRIANEVIEIDGDLFADHYKIDDILDYVTVNTDNPDIKWEVNTGASYYWDEYSELDRGAFLDDYIKNNAYKLHLVIYPVNPYGYIGEGCFTEESIKTCKIMYKGVNLNKVPSVKITPGEAQTSLYLDFTFRHAEIVDGYESGFYYEGEHVRIDSAYKANYKFDFWSIANGDMTVKIGDRYSDGTYFVNESGNGEDVKLKANYVRVPYKAAISSVSTGKRKMTVKMTTPASSKKAKAYQIAYKRKGTKTWKYVTTTSQKKTISKLKKGKKYYVKVRARNMGKHAIAYGAWSKTKLSKKIK